MKPGRNEPCPCGSGKKYKKCCYLTEENSMYTTSTGQSTENNFEDAEFLYKAFSNLRSFTLKKKPHIKEYYKIRKMHGEIINGMVQYHRNNHFVQKSFDNAIPANTSGGTFRILESSFDIETRVGGQAFYDILVYKTFPNMNCITDDFIQKHRYRKPEKIGLLHSMLDSTLGLFEITGIDFDEGYAYIKEVFTGREYTLIDIGLSSDLNNYDKFYLYTRIITYNDISFNTGLNIIFSKTDKFIKNHIRTHKEDYNPNSEFLRFTQLYNHFSQNADEIHIVTNTF